MKKKKQLSDRSRQIPHDEFLAMISGREEKAFRIVGVDRSTWLRWRRGDTLVPYPAAALLRLALDGLVPSGAGKWAGWQFREDGALVPPTWGEGIHQVDIVRLFWWRSEADRAAGLERVAARLREENHTLRGMRFATSLGQVLAEAEAQA